MIKKILFIIGFILSVIILTLGTLYVPNLISKHNVDKNVVVARFDPKVYEGQAYAYYALKRENNVLYSETPKNINALSKSQQYPKVWLPDLLKNYGIAVQKPYSGTYVFNQQKQNLLDFYNTESSVILKANDMYKVLDNKATANDGAVISALNSYTVLVDKLNTATNSMTYENAHKISMGTYIKKSVGTSDFSKPIGYGQIAQSYLEKNLNAYKSNYQDYVNKSNISSDTNITLTKQIVGIK